MALSTSSRSPPRGPCKSASDQQSATPIRNPVRSSLSAEAHHRPSYATISFARPAACFSTVASSGRHNPVVEKTAARHTAHIALTQKSPLLWRIVTNWTGAVRKRLVSRNHVAPCSDIIDNGRLTLHFRQARVIFRANRDHVSMIGHPRTRISSWITLHTYHAHTLISKVLSLSQLALWRPGKFRIRHRWGLGRRRRRRLWRKDIEHVVQPRSTSTTILIVDVVQTKPPVEYRACQNRRSSKCRQRRPRCYRGGGQRRRCGSFGARPARRSSAKNFSVQMCRDVRSAVLMRSATRCSMGARPG